MEAVDSQGHLFRKDVLTKAGSREVQGPWMGPLEGLVSFSAQDLSSGEG